MSPRVPVMVAQGCLHSAGIQFASDETKGKETLGNEMSGACSKNDMAFSTCGRAQFL